MFNKTIRDICSFPVVVTLLIIAIILILEINNFLPLRKIQKSETQLDGVLTGMGVGPEFIYRKKISQLQKIEDFIIRRPVGAQDSERFSNNDDYENEGRFRLSESSLSSDSTQGDAGRDKTFRNPPTLGMTSHGDAGKGEKSALSENVSGKHKEVSSKLVNESPDIRDDEVVIMKGYTDGSDKDDTSNKAELEANGKERNHPIEDKSAPKTDDGVISTGVQDDEDKITAEKGDDNDKSQENQTSKTKKTKRKKSKNRIDNSVVAARHFSDVTSYFLKSSKQRSRLHNIIVRKFTLKKQEAKHNFINLHRYKYVLDSSACATGNPKFVILVHSKFNNFIKRSKIRNTYAKNNTVNGVEFAVTFILGQPNIDEIGTEAFTSRKANGWRKKKTTLEDRKRRLNETMAALETESRVFKDIVMGNFVDSYRNLTIKHILAYDWVLKRCSKQLAYILKVDDDILVNTYRVARLFKQSGPDERKGLVVCDVPEGQKVIRGSTNKWFVSKEEYPFRFYPPWCKGYGVFMTRDVVKKLYEASADMRYFWIDDVYVTGLLAWRAGIHVRNFNAKQATVTRNKFRYKDVNALFVWAPFSSKNTHKQYWAEMVAAQTKHQ